MYSLRTYRERAADMSGPFWAGNPTAEGTTSYVEIAKVPFRSAADQRKRFEGYFVHRPDATNDSDKHAVVKVPDGFDPINGRLTPEASYVTPIALTERIEVLGILDADTLNKCINRGLEKCRFVDEFYATPNPNSARIDLTSRAPWLKSRKDVLEVGYIDQNEYRAEPDPYSRPLEGDFEEIAGRIYFKPGYLSDSMRVYFKAVRRHYDYCRDSDTGSYGEQSGLAEDDDESMADPEWVALAALIVAWEEYQQLMDSTANQRIIRSYQAAVAKFEEIDYDRFDPPPRRVKPRVRRWGPRR